VVIDFQKSNKEVCLEDFIREFVETGRLNAKVSYYVKNSQDVEDVSQTVVLKLLENKFFDRIDPNKGGGAVSYIGTAISNIIKNYYFKESRWRRIASSCYLPYTYSQSDISQMKRIEERCSIPEDFLSYYDELVTGGNVHITFKDSGKPLYWGYRVRDHLKNVVNS